MTVTTSRGSYDVLYTDAEDVLESLGAQDRVFIDENVKALWPDLGLPAERTFCVPSGESSKGFDMYKEAVTWLAQSRMPRNARLFAIGGGVVGDLVGFVAATYMRGVPLVMVPTTLLAMVDSSVGGKVAIDIPEGKNLVGAFWPPSEVLIAVEFLSTLPASELRNGSAEVWKYGFILDQPFLTLLESRPIDPLSDFLSIVQRCVGLKAKVVEQDEEEKTGIRAVLNFGHTIGHAIEACLGYSKLSHGEAISVGMVLESRLGETIGTTPSGLADHVRSLLMKQGLPTVLPAGLKPSDIVTYAQRDKKSGADGLGFSLLTALGQCKLVTGVPVSALEELLADT